MSKIHALLAAFLLALAAASAAAQAPAPQPTGAVTARSYAPFPAGATIAVIASDDTDQYQRLKAAIESSLRARGYTVAENAPFVLEFYATEVTGASNRDSTHGARALETAVPTNGDNSSSLGVLQPLNQNLFGEGSASSNGPSGSGALRQVHLTMMLSDQRAARRIWQGSASGEMRRPDSFAATQSLVPFLVNRIGATVANERFDVP